MGYNQFDSVMSELSGHDCPRCNLELYIETSGLDEGADLLICKECWGVAVVAKSMESIITNGRELDEKSAVPDTNNIGCNCPICSTKMKEIEVLKTNPTNEFTKKELLKLTNKHIKLVRSLSGISEMQKAPDLVFVIDTKLEHIAIAEARTLKIPVVGIIDTNCDPDLIDFPIPGNDDSRKSINLYCRLIREAINNSAGDISFDETPMKTDEITTDEVIATKNKEGA